MRREFPEISGKGKNPPATEGRNYQSEAAYITIRQPHPVLDESSILPSGWLSNVRTPEGALAPEFKEWFGKSIITTDGKPGGEPAVMYHYYVRKRFSDEQESLVFNPEKVEMGLHFGTAEAAESRSQGKSGNETITIPAVIRMESPLYMRDHGSFRVAAKDSTFASYDVRKQIMAAVIQDKVHYGLEVPEEDALESIETVKGVQDWLQLQGYDGIIYPNIEEKRDVPGLQDSVIVFNPITQIRSAITGMLVYREDGTLDL